MVGHSLAKGELFLKDPVSILGDMFSSDDRLEDPLFPLAQPVKIICFVYAVHVVQGMPPQKRM